MYAAPSPSPLRFVFAALAWVVAMALLLIGGVVKGTGQAVLTVLAIVLLVLAVAYVGLQVWYLNRAQSRPGPAAAKPDQELHPPR